MSPLRRDRDMTNSRAPALFPIRPRFRLRPSQIVFTVVLSLLLFGDLFGNWPIIAPSVLAASLPSPAKGVTTYQQFMKLGRDSHYHGKVIPNLTTSPLPKAAQARVKTPPKPKQKPSVQPAKMQPMRLPLTSTVLTANQTGTPLTQQSSDKRLEVQIPAGSLDATRAQLTTGATPATTSTGGLTLQVTQKSGHYAGISSVLGMYDFEIVDSQGHVVQGVTPRKPITIVYHYTPAELKALGIDPGHVLLTWTSLLSAAQKAKKPTTGLTILMINNKTTHTLTAQTTALAAAAVISSVPTQQQAPKPHLASVQGNSGNLTYSYPIQMPPGPGGFTPQLAFNYSSSSPNERHSPQSPAEFLGDGWTLGMGSISAQNYPDSSSGGAATWYFLSGPDGVSDRLIPDPNNVGSFYTQHLSHYKIIGTKMSSTTDTPKCFRVWDTSGTMYEYGCNSDSLQYIVDSDGNKSTYRWDLDLIVPAREGPTSAERQIKISYFQDLADDATGYTSVRDAVMAQVVYQTLSSPTSTNPTIVGTIDFKYHAPAVPGSVPSGTSSSWITSYGKNYNCQDGKGNTATPPNTTTLRCDDPNDYDSDHKAPAVMSVFSLDSMIVYVGADSANHPAYEYDFKYVDIPFYKLKDPITQDNEFAAGEHLLTNITPIVYQNGTAHNLKKIAFSYTPLTNTYYDSEETADDGDTQYQVSTNWQYLDYYVDLNTNIGETVTYQMAYSNTHGTPYVTDSNGVIIDDRHDPFYCTNHKNDTNTSKQCTGNYAHPDDHSWTVQVVTNREALGKDSGDPNLQHATYNYTYTLGVWGTYATDYSSSGPYCYPAGNPAPKGEDDCVFDTYINGPPGGEQDDDWQDFYHGEYRGFGKVYITPPNGNLIVESYYSPEAWGTPAYDPNNYQSGSLIKKDIYWGSAEIDGQLIQETVNQYSGTADFLPSGSSPYSGACTDTDVSDTYTPCEVVLVFTKTTDYEQNGTSTTNAPWVQTTYTYDDYDTSGGLKSSGYHNKIKEQITSSNAPTITKKWNYVTNDSTDSNYNYIYHTVNTVSHSEIDDASGHIWQCADTSYDQGLSGITTPAAGWPTTLKNYSDCNHTATASTTFTSYTGYDSNGNTVATVDAFGAANSSLYSSKGCTLATAPVVKSSAWTASRYTTCTVYDSYFAQPTSQQNVYGQTTSATYDDTQGRIETSSTDANGQTTSVSYGYTISADQNQSTQTLQDKDPGETGSYTTQSSSYSTCVFASKRPCYEIDDSSSLYPGAISRTFYDAQGHSTETRNPLDATHDIITFTVYNQWNDSKFISQPFRVASGSTWIDPYGATDDQGNTPVGTITITDPLGRTIATRDPIEGTSAEPGITCNNVSGTWSTCVAFSLGSPDPNSSKQYVYASTHDANNHKTVTFTDALGRTRYFKTYSVNGSINNNITTITETQYNALNKPTAVIVTDAAPQSGQTVTSVTTTTTYDDMGRQTGLNDPDRGNHTYTYDANGHLITDVSGSRTIGTSYDLLGRIRCIQDAAPTADGSGNCSSGSHPLVQNSYDTSSLQLSGTTNYIVGRLSQSIATTYYADGTSVATTQQFEYDQRGHPTATNLQVSVPTSWNVTTALPTYLKRISYNDDNQVNTTQTTVGGSTGYTFTQVYDSTTGELTGLSNNSTGAANLASQSFNGNGLVSDINFQTASGTALANDHLSYDGNLRPVGATATWQSGSGTSGTIFSTSRAFDPTGNVISATLTQSAISGQNPSTSGGSETQNFCYDELNRLVWAGNSGPQPGASNGICGNASLANTLPGATYTNSFVYTHLGQIWQAPLHGTGSAQQFLYCGSRPHQLTGIYPTGTTCATTSGATASYSASYDNWGNMTSRTYGTLSATLAYDVLDHLVQWSSTDSSNPSSSLQEWYAYDVSGNRVLRLSTSGGKTSITTYPFGLEEHSYTASGTTTSSKYYYTLGNRLIGQFDGTNTQFFLTDDLGSVLAGISSTAGSAAVLANQAYGPYGNKLYSAGTMGTSKGFTGQYEDTTGLDYYNARYYDPVVGLFITADTVESNAKGLNPYAYVGGNPETKIDPTGHDGTSFWQQLQEWWNHFMSGDPKANAEVALSDFFWGRLETISPQEIERLSTQDIIKEIPFFATVRKLTPMTTTDPITGKQRISDLKGLEFKWEINGYRMKFRIHEADSNAPENSNAFKGWTARFTRELIDKNGDTIPNTYAEYDAAGRRWVKGDQLIQKDPANLDPVIEKNIDDVHNPSSELSDTEMDHYLNSAGFRQVGDMKAPAGRLEDDPRYLAQKDLVESQVEGARAHDEPGDPENEDQIP
jgi:RHS repeat-associated protein